jgi:hypothetical protein
MNKHIHIRDFDDALHEKLVQRAQSKNMSLSQYLRIELANIAQRPTWADIAAQIKALPPVNLPQSSAEIIREIRDER